MKRQMFVLAPVWALLAWGTVTAIGPAKTLALSQADVTDFTPPLPTVPVAVMNFPDVQNVAGSVNVGNFPLAEDGSLRITGAPASVTYKLLDQAFALPSDGPGWASDWFPSGDYSTVVLAVGGSSFVCDTFWRYDGGDSATWQAGPSVGGLNPGISSSGVFGPELQVQCRGNSQGTISAVRIFLRR
jgi:hypothetical protein